MKRVSVLQDFLERVQHASDFLEHVITGECDTETKHQRFELHTPTFPRLKRHIWTWRRETGR